MDDRLRFLLNRISERLWVKPLMMCVLSIAGAFLAKMADDTGLQELVPEINAASIETLLRILSASMLVIATFAVASMVSAYASASSTATPRTFALVIAYDASTAPRRSLSPKRRCGSGPSRPAKGTPVPSPRVARRIAGVMASRAS
jgi:uncharacterized membrane protein